MNAVLHEEPAHTRHSGGRLHIVRRSGKVSTSGALLREGARLAGRYVLLDRIGKGASATVYTALDVELERKVAIKVFNVRGPYFRHEAQVLARISHPNVLQVYQVGVDDGREFIAMELVNGCNLAEWQRTGQRTVGEVVEKYAQAARGLHAAHAAGIVHRDFKPENVMLGDDGRVRVADFGLARDLATADGRGASCSESSAATVTRVILGTPAYMAPEQLESAVVDWRADQFSVCAALYEAFYGVHVFAGATLSEIRMNAAIGTIQAPRPGRRVSPALHAILVRGLAADPAARWPSMAELAAQLEAVRSPTPAAGHPRLMSALMHLCLVGTGVELAPISSAAGIDRWHVVAFLCAALVVSLLVHAHRQSREWRRIRAAGMTVRRRSIFAW